MHNKQSRTTNRSTLLASPFIALAHSLSLKPHSPQAVGVCYQEPDQGLPGDCEISTKILKINLTQTEIYMFKAQDTAERFADRISCCCSV